MTFFRGKKNPGRNNALSSYLNTLSQGVLLCRFHLVFGIPSTVFTTPYLISVDSFWFIFSVQTLPFLLSLIPPPHPRAVCSTSGPLWKEKTLFIYNFLAELKKKKISAVKNKKKGRRKSIPGKTVKTFWDR